MFKILWNSLFSSQNSTSFPHLFREIINKNEMECDEMKIKWSSTTIQVFLGKSSFAIVISRSEKWLVRLL